MVPPAIDLRLLVSVSRVFLFISLRRHRPPGVPRRSLVLEVAAPFQALGTGSSGHSSGWGPGAVLGAAGLVGEVAGDLSAVAGNMGVPLLGTNAITAFGPPPQFSIGMVSVGAPVSVAAAPANRGAGVCVGGGSVGDHKLVVCV